MRRQDTPSFLSEFLHVRAAPLVDAFRDWAARHAAFDSIWTLRADHLSYKCVEVREYDELRRRFEEHDDRWRGSRFSYQSIVSGRRVSVIGLTEPLPTPFGDLAVLELSEPKPMSAAPPGFDHVEVYARARTAAELAMAFNAFGPHRFVLKGRTHHATWDAVIPATREGRKDLILRLTDGPLVAKIGQEML